MSDSITLPIVDIILDNIRVKSFYFHCKLDAQPGQYVLVNIPNVGERPFAPIVITESTFLISVAKVGVGSNTLHGMSVGEQLSIRGPFGTYFTLPEKPGTIALVAGGYGTAPLSFLAKLAVEKGFTVKLFVGARTKFELLLYPFLHNKKIHVTKTTDDGSEGRMGFVTDAFSEYMNTELPDAVYTVGPEPMELKVINMCQRKNIPFQASFERFVHSPFGPVIDHIKFATLFQGQKIYDQS
ncbi:MAG: dihydroorotate dehydrogenase electron transfer subunit [Patescibacteria group bacterium]|nr:dihydroorotate dehydrogenase electron transfer subunit [Patescibacteria group bacterium]